jgi:hypothetical protein
LKNRQPEERGKEKKQRYDEAVKGRRCGDCSKMSQITAQQVSTILDMATPGKQEK